jgi:acyl CoA:acetate/3-ketoacid CoA transferase alpha subunit
MKMNKIFNTCDEAVSDVFDDATIMVSGFGSFGGLPINLLISLTK